VVSSTSSGYGFAKSLCRLADVGLGDVDDELPITKDVPVGVVRAPTDEVEHVIGNEAKRESAAVHLAVGDFAFFEGRDREHALRDLDVPPQAAVRLPLVAILWQSTEER
jgi:hypothetical protein